MLLGGAGLTDVNILQSNAGAFRNEDLRTALGSAFQKATTLAGVAAENAHIQVFNTEGSGVVVIVDELIFSPESDSVINIRSFTTALTSDVSAGVSVLIGGTAATAHVRRQSNAGELGAQITTFRILARDLIIYRPPNPYMLDPGEGIMVVNASVNITVAAGFAWREV